MTSGADALCNCEIASVIRADIHEIPGLFARIQRFGADCGIAEAALFKIELALDELINNVIDHGYPGRAPGEIAVRLRCEGDRIDIELSDDADLYDPFGIATPDLDADIEDRPLGGLGVHLVRSLMSEARYRVVDGRNSIQLSLALKEPT